METILSDLWLHVVRDDSRESTTMGKLFIDGQFQWFTLEDQWRPAGIKIQGETCIPAGVYEVVLTLSARFKVVLPELLNVPGFSGIRIHGGNTNQDTSGCILVGGGAQPDAKPLPRINNCSVAVNAIVARIREVTSAGKRVWIEVIDPDTKTNTETPTEGEAMPTGQTGPALLPSGVKGDVVD